jgi:pimeloyl-ACP methyl ester carboxylesterase
MDIRTLGGVGRRGFLAAGGAALAAGALAPAAHAGTQAVLPAQTTWNPVPPQAPQTEDMVQVPGAKLWCWDTGGPGEPIVLLHPATGSGAVWGYQQPVLAAAGYRVVGYSRRGHYRSEPGPKDDPGSGAADLAALADHLKLPPFHLVGVAAGGFIVPDFALSYPERLLSMTIASSLGGVTDPAFSQATAAMTGGGFRDLSPALRELGPSYRGGNPQGAQLWEQAEHAARPVAVNQKPLNNLTWEAIAGIRTPTLLMTGDADMFMPPSRMRESAARFPKAELVVVAEAGHAIYWEQPTAFNQAILGFVRRHGTKA